MINVKAFNTVIRCSCGYSWNYTGIGFNAKCPRCGKYTKVVSKSEEKDQEK